MTTATKVYTLGFIQRDDQVLLGLKKRGFGQGKWNGFGGKVQPEENLDQALLREFKEETGLQIMTYRWQGVMRSHHPHNEPVHAVHVAMVTAWQGEPEETEEMRPQWWSVTNLPFDHMWPDDRIWLLDVLAGKTVEADFYFDDQDQLISHNYNTIAE